MKLKNWKIYECESSTWKVVTKKGLIKQSNLDIIASKYLQANQIQVEF